LSRRFGKKKSAILMFAFGITVNSVPLILGLLGVIATKPSNGLLAFIFAFSTIGAAFAIGSSIMLISMIADVVEDSELRTGRRSEGLFFAGSSFLQKAASGLGLFASGLVLWAAHFPSDKQPGQVDPHIVWNFAIVFLTTIAVLYGIAFVIISRFPITRGTHEANLRKLADEAALLSPTIAVDEAVVKDNTPADAAVRPVS
jgi:Na+/melibiose symporter-like transporter